MDPRLWGPPCWETMHAITFTYPESNPNKQDREHMAQFFYGLADVLPCYTCRTHFNKMLDEHRIEKNLDSRDALTRWLVDRHNDVNRRLGKPQVPYDFVAAKYSNYYATTKCTSNAIAVAPKQASRTNKKRNKKILMIVLIVVLFIMLIMILYACFRTNKR